jgi:hypothetical protein
LEEGKIKLEEEKTEMIMKLLEVDFYKQEPHFKYIEAI